MIQDYWGVKVPDKQVCPNHSTPWRAFKEAYFGESVTSVWKASRGFGGKSFTLALLGLTEATTLGADVNILGASGEQGTRVHEHMLAFWDHVGSPKQVLIDDPTKKETRLVTRNNIRVLMASQKSVRGPHPQRLRCDEVDEMEQEILDAAAGQPMSKNEIPKQTVYSSTHQNPNGVMTHLLERAADEGWAVHEWCWRETLEPHGWLTLEEVESKRREVPRSMWETEYDLQEPSPQNRAILPEKVTRMFRREYGEFAGKPGETICIEDYDRRGRYAIGVDWAKSNDWTVIVVLRLDVKPAKVVFFLRIGRLPWPQMVKAADRACWQYKPFGMHDANGVGSVVDDLIGYKRLEGVILSGRDRTDTLANYVKAVENEEVAAPMIRSMEREHRTASTDSLYGSGHLPDTISAMALAWRAAMMYNVIRGIQLGERGRWEDTGVI